MLSVSCFSAASMFTQKTEEEQNLKDGEEDDFETDDDDGEVSEMEVENQTQKRKKVSVTDLIDCMCIIWSIWC